MDEVGWDMAAIAARLDGIAALTGAPCVATPSGTHPHQIAQYTGSLFAAVPLRAPCTLELEAELRGALIAMMGLDSGTTCVLTGSGTESILLALLSIRHRSRAAGGEIVVASNVHPSVLRAAAIVGFKPIVTAVDSASRADPRQYVQAIGEATLALFVSAPAWASGETDPLAEIATLARARGLACHVDASIGGMLFPAWTFDGRRAPALQARGVTSLSVDLHKFGYAPRGLSAVCFSDAAGAERAAFVDESWDGFVYRAGRLGAEPPFAPIAGAWAVMRSLGARGYQSLARKLHDRREALRRRLAGSEIDADCAVHGAVLRLRPRHRSLDNLSHRLQELGVHHIPCRRGFLRLRVDPLIDDAEFLQLSTRLVTAARSA